MSARVTWILVNTWWITVYIIIKKDKSGSKLRTISKEKSGLKSESKLELKVGNKISKKFENNDEMQHQKSHTLNWIKKKKKFKVFF